MQISMLSQTETKAFYGDIGNLKEKLDFVF